MKRTIAISLSPNAQKDDIWLAIKTLLNFGKWNDQKEVDKFEEEFAAYFGKGYYALAVNSGRSAEYLILKALNIKTEDLVAIQALTCVVVPNSIIWTGAKPLYIDIDSSYNLDPVDLQKKVQRNLKAIIIQHSFGIPGQVTAINKIAKKYQIPIIEDCAHSLGADIDGQKIGTFGKVAFFSFGRDKIISSVFGGMILCRDKNLYRKIAKEVNRLVLPSRFWTVQQLLHPILFLLILPLYNLQIGKLLLLIFQKLKLLSKAVYPEEKKGQQPVVFPKKFPGGLAILARHQFKKLDSFNRHRRTIAKIYFSKIKNMPLSLPPRDPNAVWLRFPIRCQNNQQLFKYFKSRGIILGDWYKKVVYPVKNFKLVYYKIGSCPQAEKYSSQILNLPTYVGLTIKETNYIISLIKKWINIQPEK